MTNRLEMAGVVLEGRKSVWYVDGEEMYDVDAALRVFLQRVYPSSQELPRALTQHIRRYAGMQLCSPQTMVRRARDRAGFKSQRALAKASGVSKSTVSAIERGECDPRASTLFNITHAVDSRR